MRIADELIAWVERATAIVGDPLVARAHIPEPHPDPARDAEFGLLELEDGNAGLYYAWLGAAQRGMAARFPSRAILGRRCRELARWLAAPDEAAKSIGMAAINALTARVWRCAGYAPPAAQDSFGVALAPGDRLGMIGNFPSLVRQARSAGLAVTVIERKAHMVMRDAQVEITLDPAALRACNKVVCTAAVLLNDSLDAMLPFCRDASQLAMVGPTAGCFPEPLFARGVGVVGGTLITDASAARARLAYGEKLGDAARRYQLTPADYPGTAALLTICDQLRG
jgi:uncharacterized protein (DUF4213/DUF364 family)